VSPKLATLATSLELLYISSDGTGRRRTYPTRWLRCYGAQSTCSNRHKVPVKPLFIKPFLYLAVTSFGTWVHGEKGNAAGMRTHGCFGAYDDQAKCCLVSLNRVMRLWLLVQSVPFTNGFTVLGSCLHPDVLTAVRRTVTFRNDDFCMARLTSRRASSSLTWRNPGRRRLQHPAKHPILVRPVSGTDEAIDSFISGPSVNRLDQFVTPLLQVYIEDTDAYGVMYNGNYLRAYDRALHMMLEPSPSAAALGDRDDWSIVSVEGLKFKSPPPLGGTYCIEGTRRRRPTNDVPVAGDWGNGTFVSDPVLAHSDECTTKTNRSPDNANHGEEEVWDMIMRSPDGSIVYNTATGVALARSPSVQREPSFSMSSLAAANDESHVDWLPSPPPLVLPDGSPATTAITSSIDTFRTYRDEFEPHLNSHVPLRIALNYMERARTNCIGGPSMLHELQNTHGVLYVVTAVRNCSLVSYNTDPINGGGVNVGRRSQRPLLVPGMQVEVETGFRVRKRGAIIDCYHSLVFEDATDPTARQRLAQGVVTIMALDANTRRPTNKLPSWLRSRFGISDPAA
jgi:hypothetical protein